MRFRSAVLSLLLASSQSIAGEPDREPRPIEKVLPEFRRFGITTEAQLREELVRRASPRPEVSRQHVWMLGWLYDDVGRLPLLQQLRLQSPNDLEYVLGEARALLLAERNEEAWARLLEAEGRELVIVDDRTHPMFPQDVDAMRCLAMDRLRSPREALPYCERAMQSPSLEGAEISARIYLKLGDANAALAQAQRAVMLVDGLDHRHWAHLSLKADAQFLEGVAQLLLGREEEALQAWERARETNLQHVPSNRALKRLDRTLSQFLVTLKSWDRRRIADTDAMTGHYYLDLDLPDRAEPHLVRADELYPGRGTQERIAHVAEKDPRRALELGEAALADTRSIPLLTATGWLQHRAGSNKRARAYLEEVLAREPENYQANINLGTVCLRMGDTECADAHFANTVTDPKRQLLIATLKFCGLLLPLGLLYAGIRRKLMKRSP